MSSSIRKTSDEIYNAIGELLDIAETTLTEEDLELLLEDLNIRISTIPAEEYEYPSERR
jgi:chaperonin cofactor prefoldin